MRERKAPPELKYAVAAPALPGFDLETSAPTETPPSIRPVARDGRINHPPNKEDLLERFPVIKQILASTFYPPDEPSFQQAAKQPCRERAWRE